MPVDHPRIVLWTSKHVLSFLLSLYSYCIWRWKHEIRRVEEVAKAGRSVRDERKDLGDEGLLDEGCEWCVELGQSGLAYRIRAFQ